MPCDSNRNSSLVFFSVLVLFLILAVAFAARAQDSVGFFLPAVTYDSSGSSAFSVAVADLNADGKPDIVAANEFSSSVAVLLGNGDGSFQRASIYSSGGIYAQSVKIADVNGDTKPDLLVAVRSNTGDCVGMCDGGAVAVLLGRGDGTFQAAIKYGAGGVASWSLVAGDVNGDSKLDLVIANNCVENSDCSTGTVGVLRGNGDGTFQPAVSYPAGFDPRNVVLGDLNRDGNLDIVVANLGNSQKTGSNGAVSILVGNGDGTFQPLISYQPGGFFTNSVAIADVNEDNKPDLLTANYACVLYKENTGCIGVLLGNGDATFQPAITYDAGAAYSIAVADINDDAKPDVVVASTPVGVSVLLGYGDGSFQAPARQTVSPYNAGGEVVAADLNGDRRVDVVVGTSTGNLDKGFVGVLLNNARSSGISTKTTLDSSLNPSIFGQAVTLTAEVNATSGMATGIVRLFDGSIGIGSGALINGKAPISVSYLPAGSNSITAAYQASSGFAGSKSVPVNQIVRPATTATGITSSLNPLASDQPITYTASVTSQYGGLTTGSVVFASGSQILGTSPLNANRAILTTWLMTPGTYSISARYLGDANNAGSTSPILSQMVIPPTRIFVSSSLNPAAVGQPITLSAFVSSTAGFPPDGEVVIFRNGSGVLGTAVLSGGMASSTIAWLPAGIYTITASYAGDSHFAPNTSLPLRQVVKSSTKFVTSATLVSNLNPALYGQAVTWAAMVKSSGPVVPTGNVSFSWSFGGQNFNIGTAALNANGVAMLTKGNLNANPFGAPYPLVAVYSGDAVNLGSTSTVLAQDVLQTKSAARITSSVNPSAQGQAVTFTAKITSPTVMPTGPVYFSVGTTVLGTAQLTGGTAKFSTSALPVGSDVVKVTYYGNSNIAKSVASLVQTVH